MRGNVSCSSTPTRHSHGMSRPLLAEPPPKRQRAPGEDEVNTEDPEDLEEDREFKRLEAVSTVQDELNALEDEEARQVGMHIVLYCSCCRGRAARPSGEGTPSTSPMRSCITCSFDAMLVSFEVLLHVA